MNYRRGILINISLFLLFLTILLVLPRIGIPKVVYTAPQDKSLFRYNVSDIAAVAIINDYSRFGLIYDGSKIKLEPNQADASYSEEAMQSFIYRISKLDYQRKINPDQKEESFGLVSPLVKGTIIMANGDKVRILMGKKNPVDGSYYFKKDGEEQVYLISGVDALLFLSKPSDFLNRQILPHVDLKDLNSVKEISLSFGNMDLPFFKIVNQGNFIFRLSEPYRNSLDYEAVLSKLIFPILSLDPEHRLADTGKPPLSGKADILLSVRLEEIIYNLSFYKNDAGSYYVTSSSFPGIFEIDESSMPFRSLHYLDLMNEAIYHINVSEISNILIQDVSGGLDYDIEFSGETVNLKGIINDIPVEYPKMMDLYETLFRTSIARELGDELVPDAGTLESSLKMIISKKNGSIDRIEFVQAKGNEQFLFVNEIANFTSYNTAVQDIKKKLQELTTETDL